MMGAGCHAFQGVFHQVLDFPGGLRTFLRQTAYLSGHHRKTFASLTGAGFATGGTQALIGAGWQKVLIGLGLSTFLGFFGGLVIVVAIYWTFRRFSVGRVQAIYAPKRFPTPREMAAATAPERARLIEKGFFNQS